MQAFEKAPLHDVHFSLGRLEWLSMKEESNSACNLKLQPLVWVNFNRKWAENGFGEQCFKRLSSVSFLVFTEFLSENSVSFSQPFIRPENVP